MKKLSIVNIFLHFNNRPEAVKKLTLILVTIQV